MPDPVVFVLGFVVGAACTAILDWVTSWLVVTSEGL